MAVPARAGSQILESVGVVMTAIEASIPLDRAALCVGCGLIFHVSHRVCPGCGGENGWCLIEKRGNETAGSATHEPDRATRKEVNTR